MSHPSERLVISQAREIGQSLASQLRQNEPAADRPLSTASLALVESVLNEHLAMLAATGCWGEANRLPSSSFWAEAGAWLSLGSLQLHARTKPLGYAGDYQMLDRICRNDVSGNGLGLAMDLYFQAHAAPTAVRNRAEVVRDALVHFADSRADKEWHVVSFGCGPAFDLLAALRECTTRERVRCTLVDMDPRALDFAVQRIRPLLPGEDQLRSVRLNLARFARIVASSPPFPPADFLTCAGFFDYLRHDEAVAMLQAFQQVLQPDGQWIAFNFGDDNPSQAYMEWIGNWYLRYRNRETMAQIAEDAGLHHFELDVEPAGVNFYLRGSKT